MSFILEPQTGGGFVLNQVGGAQGPAGASELPSAPASQSLLIIKPDGEAAFAGTLETSEIIGNVLVKDGARSVQLRGGLGVVEHKGGTGGWFIGEEYYTNNGTKVGVVGALGTANTPLYMLIGASDVDTTMKLYPSTKVVEFEGAVSFDDGKTASSGIPITLKAFGAVGDGTTDDTAAVVAFFAEAVSSGRSWYVNPGTYLVNHSSAITIKTSGSCDGLFKIPKANTTCWFEIARDAAGAVLSTSGWGALTRGNTTVGASNAAGKHLFVLSTEVVSNRNGYATPYYKQEFLRCDQSGNMTSAPVCTYTNYANVTVTAHTPSVPIQIDRLRVLRSGAGPVGARGSIFVFRDNVTLNQPEVRNETPAVPLDFAIEVGYCADVTLNRPFVYGCQSAGLGYGIIATATIGLTINDATMISCRRGLSGAYNVDLTVHGGNWQDGIDDHWGNRMVINDANIYVLSNGSAVSYAGYDISISNVSTFGGRNLLGIRIDTPSLGGIVSIKNSKVQSADASTSYYLFGFTSDNGTGAISPAFTVKPFLPDIVVIEDAHISVGGGVSYASIARLGTLATAHTNWGTVVVRGSIISNVLVFGIFADKNSTYQEDRTATLQVDELDCAGGSAIYVTAADATATRGYKCRVNRVTGDVRYCGFGVSQMEIANSRIANMTQDAANAWGNTLTTVSDSVLTGGAIGANFRNVAFYNCTFVGTITQFPFDGVTNYATLVGNTRTVAQANMPADIRANIVSPYL
jgi:hypothetical protein